MGSGAPAWSRSRCGAGSGRVVPPTNDVVLNALRGARFCEVWWAGLTLRGATAAALAGGALWTVPSRLGDLESYTGVGLGPGREPAAGLADLDPPAAGVRRGPGSCRDPDPGRGGPGTERRCGHGLGRCARGGGPLPSGGPAGTWGYDAATIARVHRAGWDAPMPGARSILTGDPCLLSDPRRTCRRCWPGRTAPSPSCTTAWSRRAPAGSPPRLRPHRHVHELPNARRGGHGDAQSAS